MTKKELLQMELEKKLSQTFGRKASIEFRCTALPQLNTAGLVALKEMLEAK